MSSSLNRTVLYQEHQKLNAKFVDFAGFEMPVSYEGVVPEHMCVREHVGLFDVSHMGEFFVEGEKALDFLQYLTINDVSKLKNGQAQYSAMCYEHGGIIDDILIYRIKQDKFMVVVNASNRAKDWEWMNSYAKNYDIQFKDKTDEYSLIAIQGPKSIKVIEKLIQSPISDLQYYHFIEKTIAGKDCILSRTGYTGELGFEIYLKNEDAVNIWQQLLALGEEFHIRPIGLGARDTLRFEVCFPLYGNELDDKLTPIEADLRWVVKLNKGNFIGKQIIENKVKNGIDRHLVGLELLDNGIARHGYELYADVAKQNLIGYVTTGTKGPSVQKSIALGYVSKGYESINMDVYVDIRGKLKKAKVVKRPFYAKNT